METLTAIRDEEAAGPQLMFGGCPVDPDLIGSCVPPPGWDATFDETLDSRCSSL